MGNSDDFLFSMSGDDDFTKKMQEWNRRAIEASNKNDRWFLPLLILGVLLAILPGFIHCYLIFITVPLLAVLISAHSLRWYDRKLVELDKEIFGDT